MKVTIKGYVHKDIHGSGFSFFSNDMSEYGYVKVAQHEIEFEVPADFNPIKEQVKLLEKQLDVMADEYHTKVKHVKDKIAELQCIEYSPSDAAKDFSDYPF